MEALVRWNHPTHLQNPSLFADILTVFEETGLKPEYLDIEITENALTDVKNSIQTLQTLKEIVLASA